MHDFSGMADAGGMGYPPSPLIGPWPRVFGCGAGVFKHQPFALLVCSIQHRFVKGSPASKAGGELT